MIAVESYKKVKVLRGRWQSIRQIAACPGVSVNALHRIPEGDSGPSRFKSGPLRSSRVDALGDYLLGRIEVVRRDRSPVTVVATWVMGRGYENGMRIRILQDNLK